MKIFAQLYRDLDFLDKPEKSIRVLVDYFSKAKNRDKVWAIALFFQKRPKRIVNLNHLKKWAIESSNLPNWLFEESYNIVGDLSETIALITPNPSLASEQTLSDWIRVILDINDKEDMIKRETILNAWKTLDQNERFIFNKLVTGGFRIGVSQKSVIKALSKYSGIEENKITYRLMEQWDPLTVSFEDLVLKSNPKEDLSKPYPFYLPVPLDIDTRLLGATKEWIAERKWDGIRCQLILRQDEYYLWSRGKELVTKKFPELGELAKRLNKNVVIDGEIIPLKDEKILNKQVLVARMRRKNITKKHLLEAPSIIVAFDLLEYEGEDWRKKPLEIRKAKLEEIVMEVSSSHLIFSDSVKFDSWKALDAERNKSRRYQSEGLILKRKNSIYSKDKTPGEWLKWEADPMTIEAVMIYAQRGAGQQSKLYTGFTFAVRKGEELIPFTKTNTGLTDVELEEISEFVKNNTIERFGPVRVIKPELVFEIAFAGITISSRHKSGVILKLPRVQRWVRSKSKEEINSMKDLLKKLEEYEQN